MQSASEHILNMLLYKLFYPTAYYEKIEDQLIALFKNAHYAGGVEEMKALAETLIPFKVSH